MRATKWIFLGYLILTGLVLVGIFASFNLAPARDPNTLYRAYGANLKSLDPAEISDTESSAIAGSI
ncbi:MAG: hypothetical protein WCI73_11620, partial [Phycisphaerae bacterium]